MKKVSALFIFSVIPWSTKKKYRIFFFKECSFLGSDIDWQKSLLSFSFPYIGYAVLVAMVINPPVIVLVQYDHIHPISLHKDVRTFLLTRECLISWRCWFFLSIFSCISLAVVGMVSVFFLLSITFSGLVLKGYEKTIKIEEL